MKRNTFIGTTVTSYHLKITSITCFFFFYQIINLIHDFLWVNIELQITSHSTIRKKLWFTESSSLHTILETITFATLRFGFKTTRRYSYSQAIRERLEIGRHYTLHTNKIHTSFQLQEIHTTS